VTHGIDAHSGSMLDDICARLDPSLSPEVRESIGFFVDQLVASLTLGAPCALTDQLQWQTRRLRVLAPGLDAERLALATRAVVEQRLGGPDLVKDLALSPTDHLELALDTLVHHPAPETSGQDLGELARHYLELALADDHDDAVDLVLASGLTPQEVLLHLLEPAQVELGRRWEHGDVPVAREHETTALTQRVMALLRGRERSVALNGGTVYAGVVGDELHRVGLEMVTDLLGLAGWSVVQAPGALDHATVVEEVARVRPDVVALSVTLLTHVVELRTVVEALKSDERTRHVPVIVGGRPFRRDPALADVVGADAWAADGRGAVEACRRATEGLSGRHVSDVTRELVSPLETMLGLAALLKDDASLSHRQRDLAGRIIKAGGQLMTVVEDLGHGLVEIHGGPGERSSSGLVDLDELVESLLVRHQGRAAQRDIVMRQIRMPPERGRVTVEGDVSQLERVIDTLFDNAVAVTPTSGVVTARIRRTGGVVTVAVADEGPPIPAHGHEAIFDAGRATSSSGATDLGPWRGLALVRRIAEQHGGRLDATSDHRGAVFTLQLPLSSTMLAHEVPDVPTTFPRLSVVREPGSGSAG
jgi:MerR family transcriptional regulator, light-induced transcriptional regulator